MTNHPHHIAILAALALTATLVYIGLPILMSVPIMAQTIDRYVLHPQNPLITGIVVGLGFALLGLLTYLFYCVLQPPAKAVNKLETDAP